MAMSRTLLLSLLAATACNSSSGGSNAVKDASSTRLRLSLNDVSVMFPLSHSPDFAEKSINGFDNHTVVDSAGAQITERFLPEDMLLLLDKQSRSSFFSMGGFDRNYRLVAMRIDPCFNIMSVGGDDSKCQQQLRLLWQPVQIVRKTVGSEQQINVDAADQGVHAVYKLSRQEFGDILSKLTDEKAKAGFDYDNEPLGPNPLLIKQGTGGSYYAALRAIVNQFAARSRLVGMTGMTGGNQFGWSMTGIQVVNGVPTSLELIGVDFATVGFRGTRTSQFFFPGGFTFEARQTEPKANGPDQYLDFSSVPVFNGHGDNNPDSNAARDAAQAGAPAAMAAKLPALYRVLDPALHDVTNTDCGSCHLAATALSMAAKAGVQTLDGTSVYNTSWNVANMVSKSNPLRLNMFGFGGTTGVRQNGFMPPQILVQPRVITESVVVADFINEHYLK